MWAGTSPLKGVVAPDGITTPDGLYLPRGAKIGISAPTVHYDADRYPDPTTYYPWRFVTKAAETPLGIDGKDGRGHTSQTAEADETPSPRGRGPTIVTTGRDFMAFRHGRKSG